MYITRVEIQNIRSIEHLVWEIDAGQAAGWHVILGDNGSGKSTFVQAIALSLLGVEGFYRLQQDGVDWLMKNRRKGKITTDLVRDFDYDQGRDSQNVLSVGLDMTRLNQKVGLAGHFPIDLNDEKGWFAASYGPFRRFGHNDSSNQKPFGNNPKLARHLSNFDENAAFSEGPMWLRDLDHKNLEQDAKSQDLLNNITSLINQDGLLPNGTELRDVQSGGIVFQIPEGHLIPVESLSAGYRSILSFILELIRQLAITYESNIFEVSPDGMVWVTVPGVVIVDEIDSHLHPTWQKDIGFWLTKHFPNIQFIVTTHSPLVCQAAEKGTIFRLPTPGTDEKGRMLEGQERNRLLYGNILDAYSTQAFGYGVTRSKSSEEKLDRLADLNIKEMMQGLTPEETIEQNTLRDMLPSSAAILRSGKSV